MDLAYLDDLWAFLGRHDCGGESKGIVRGYLDLAELKVSERRILESYRVAPDKDCLLENLKLVAGEGAKEAELYLHQVIANQYFRQGYKEIVGHEPGPGDGEIGRALAEESWVPERKYLQ